MKPIDNNYCYNYYKLIKSLLLLRLLTISTELNIGLLNEWILID